MSSPSQDESREIDDISKQTDEEDDFPEDIFFLSRGINLKEGVLLDCGFDKCLEALKDESIENAQIVNIQDAYSTLGHEINKDTKALVISFFLRECFDHKKYRLKKEFPIELDDGHVSIADNAIYDCEAQRAVLFNEVQMDSLYSAIIGTFDLLRSYSFFTEGQNLPFFYGIATTLHEWVFCCYLRPEGRKAAGYHHFLVSGTRKLIKGDDGKPTADSVKTILSFIKGFLRSDVDEIVSQTLSNKSERITKEP